MVSNSVGVRSDEGIETEFKTALSSSSIQHDSLSIKEDNDASCDPLTHRPGISLTLTPREKLSGPKLPKTSSARAALSQAEVARELKVRETLVIDSLNSLASSDQASAESTHIQRLETCLGSLSHLPAELLTPVKACSFPSALQPPESLPLSIPVRLKTSFSPEEVDDITEFIDRFIIELRPSFSHGLSILTRPMFCRLVLDLGIVAEAQNIIPPSNPDADPINFISLSEAVTLFDHYSLPISTPHPFAFAVSATVAASVIDLIIDKAVENEVAKVHHHGRLKSGVLTVIAGQRAARSFGFLKESVAPSTTLAEPPSSGKIRKSTGNYLRKRVLSLCGDLVMRYREDSEIPTEVRGKAVQSCPSPSAAFSCRRSLKWATTVCSEPEVLAVTKYMIPICDKIVQIYGEFNPRNYFQLDFKSFYTVCVDLELPVSFATAESLFRSAKCLSKFRVSPAPSVSSPRSVDSTRSWIFDPLSSQSDSQRSAIAIFSALERWTAIRKFKVIDLFTTLDEDGSGTLSPYELQVGLKKLGLSFPNWDLERFTHALSAVVASSFISCNSSELKIEDLSKVVIRVKELRSNYRARYHALSANFTLPEPDWKFAELLANLPTDPFPQSDDAIITAEDFAENLVKTRDGVRLRREKQRRGLTRPSVAELNSITEFEILDCARLFDGGELDGTVVVKDARAAWRALKSKGAPPRLKDHGKVDSNEVLFFGGAALSEVISKLGILEYAFDPRNYFQGTAPRWLNALRMHLEVHMAIDRISANPGERAPVAQKLSATFTAESGEWTTRELPKIESDWRRTEISRSDTDGFCPKCKKINPACISCCAGVELQGFGLDALL